MHSGRDGCERNGVGGGGDSGWGGVCGGGGGLWLELFGVRVQ